MKKLFGIALIIILSTSVLAGCGDNNASTGTPTAAAPDADLTPAGTDTETDTEEITITSAIDLTAYPVMWYREDRLYPEMYDSWFKTTSASEIYEEDDIIGSIFVGFRLVDDTHIEGFAHYKLNDDIDASLLLSSLDDEIFTQREMIRINDREAENINQTLIYEIDGTNIFISDGQNTFTNYSVSPDFTSFFQGQSEYTYHADF